ncbi:hypothetical protein AB9K26_01785 [Psychroserpens sp. XS_ASV72]|uniref:hypothetical protein n=1 Tax=Psychroserpens sp. XS_ASV72 TaxID=3241293 RepID=UPI0035195A78
MKFLSTYSKFIPYLYFIAIIAYWFTIVNRNVGISAFPILLFGIPFVWQIVKPSRKLNFTLGITFVCLSSYLILAYISDMLNIINLSTTTKQFIVYGGLFVVANFVMALWMIRNSIQRAF